MKVKLSIGDWSHDGHNQSEEFVFEVNKSVEEIRQAYKDSCKLAGIQFNHNDNYIGIEYDWRESHKYECFTEYEDSRMRSDISKKLKAVGLDVSKYAINDEDDEQEQGEFCFETDGFALLLMEFIKLSLSDLTYEEAAFKKSELKTIPPINGWWNKDLNVQFGYGLFY